METSGPGGYGNYGAPRIALCDPFPKTSDQSGPTLIVAAFPKIFLLFSCVSGIGSPTLERSGPGILFTTGPSRTEAFGRRGVECEVWYNDYTRHMYIYIYIYIYKYIWHVNLTPI